MFGHIYPWAEGASVRVLKENTVQYNTKIECKPMLCLRSPAH